MSKRTSIPEPSMIRDTEHAEELRDIAQQLRTLAEILAEELYQPQLSAEAEQHAEQLELIAAELGLEALYE